MVSSYSWALGIITNPINLMKSILERLGHTVHTEKRGKDGVNAALKIKFDLILMDIQLPDMSGVDVMKGIREKAERKIPIIALTAYAMEGDEKRFIAEGFDGYISKPIDVENVTNAIENFIKL